MSEGHMHDFVWAPPFDRPLGVHDCEVVDCAEPADYGQYFCAAHDEQTAERSC